MKRKERARVKAHDAAMKKKEKALQMKATEKKEATASEPTEVAMTVA